MMDSIRDMLVFWSDGTPSPDRRCFWGMPLDRAASHEWSAPVAVRRVQTTYGAPDPDASTGT
jgi:hypothetical protein